MEKSGLISINLHLTVPDISLITLRCNLLKVELTAVISRLDTGSVTVTLSSFYPRRPTPMIPPSPTKITLPDP